jgi:CheY-like chemotaxis protein
MQVSAHTATARQHIFAVNDSPEFLEILRELLQDERYHVTTTDVASVTFDTIAALDPSLLIIDLVDGRRKAWDLLERLGSDAATRRIPVIVTSTSRHVLDEAEADPARFGGHRFLRKPFNLDELLETVTDVIGPA